MFKLALEKAEEPEIKLSTSVESQEQQENSRRNIYFYFIDFLKLLTVWITSNCGNFLKRWEYQATLPASCEICMQVKKQQLELDVEQQTDSKLAKEYIEAVSPCLFNFYSEYIMQNSRLDEAQTGIKIAWRYIKTSDMQMTPPLWKKAKRN